MAAYSLILFDLDGTLTDPKDGITKSVQYALYKLGIEETNLDSLTPFIGPPLHDSFQQIYRLSPLETQRAVKFYREYFTQRGMCENLMYEGIPWLLQSLKNQSRKLVVATSKPTVFAEAIIKYFRIEQFFEHVIGSNLDGTRSNKGEIIQHAMGYYSDRSKTDFVMVGDREQDIIGANANGIDSIGVLYGYGLREELTKARATYVANAVQEVFDILTN